MYTVRILRRAQKELASLPDETLERLVEAIRGLGEDPRPAGCRRLSGRGGWRIRAGDYRVIFEVDDSAQTVTVLHVGHRRSVYR